MNRVAQTVNIICVLTLLSLAYGCFGGPGPVQKYLRLSLETREAGHGHAPATGIKDPDEKLILALKELTELPALNRTAVLLAQGSVLTPSTTWYWEGTPAEVLSQALVHGLSRSQTYNVAWPYRPRVFRSAQVSGRVLAFEVHSGGTGRKRFFTLTFHLDLWDAHGKMWLGGKTFHGKQEIQGFSPELVTVAASRAVAATVQEAIGWLESHARKIKALDPWPQVKFKSCKPLCGKGG